MDEEVVLHRQRVTSLFQTYLPTIFDISRLLSTTSFLKRVVKIFSLITRQKISVITSRRLKGI